MKFIIFGLLLTLSNTLLAQSGPRVVYKADRFGYCVEYTASGRRIGFVEDVLCAPGQVDRHVFIRDNFGYCVEMTAAGRRIGFTSDENCCY